jgi:hypothetical protein
MWRPQEGNLAHNTVNPLTYALTNHMVYVSPKNSYGIYLIPSAAVFRLGLWELMDPEGSHLINGLIHLRVLKVTIGK